MKYYEREGGENTNTKYVETSGLGRGILDLFLQILRQTRVVKIYHYNESATRGLTHLASLVN